MIHIRYDDAEEAHFGHRYACGLTALPHGDKHFYSSDALAFTELGADCPGCNPTPRRIGAPLSQLSGRPGEPGFAAFSAIAASWGYE